MNTYKQDLEQKRRRLLPYLHLVQWQCEYNRITKLLEEIDVEEASPRVDDEKQRDVGPPLCTIKPPKWD